MRVGKPVKPLPQPHCDYCGAPASLVHAPATKPTLTETITARYGYARAVRRGSASFRGALAMSRSAGSPTRGFET